MLDLVFPKVKKRVGLVQNYSIDKVFQVVLNALNDSEAVEARNFTTDTVDLANDIVDDINYAVIESNNNVISSSEMQKIIYKTLIDYNEVIAARQYMLYSTKKMQKQTDNNDLLNAVSKVFNKDPNVIHENGNKDSRILPAQRDLIVSQIFRALGIKIYDKDIQEAHKKGLIHLHDLDMSPLLPYTNCCNVNAKDMFENGFKMGETFISSPQSIGVASALIALIIQDVSTSQYGGTSIPNIDLVLAPYARLTYQKHLKDAKKYNIKGAEEYAWDLTKRDIYQAMQGLEYNINCLHGTGGQVPFVTLSFGLATDRFGTEIQRAMLKVRIKGMNGKSAIFPKLVVTLDKGINMFPNDPNYDIKKSVLKCQSLRDYPDIVFGKNIKEITGGSYMTSMGCVRGQSVVSYNYEGKRYTTSFEKMYEQFKEHEKVQPNGVDKYIDLEGVTIKDSHRGVAEYVPCLKLIKNVTPHKWLKFTIKNGIDFICTDDHPLEIEGKGRVLAKDIKLGDCVLKSKKRKHRYGISTYILKMLEITKIKTINLNEPCYDVTTATDFFDVDGIVSHNCRSFLPAWKNESDEYQISGRLNLGVVTVNPVHCALESRTIDEFWSNFKESVRIAHKALKVRINRIRQVKPQEAPIIWQQGAIARLKDDEDVTPVLKNKRCTVSLGYIGIYETVTKFFGNNWEHNKEAYEFALSITKYLHQKCQEWYKEEGYYYSLYSTPSENLTGRFCKIDKEEFGSIKDITDKGYYNNSFHYDVRKPVTPFEKMKFEAPFQHIATGGFISYNELPDMRNNLDALEKVIDYSYDTGIGYLGTNIPMDKCLNCGFTGKCLETANGFKCPECGEKKHLQIVERLCGLK